MILNWRSGQVPGNPAALARLAEVIDAVSGHVQDQLDAFTEQPGRPLPAYSSMTDLLIGAYIWGLLESYVRNVPSHYPAMGGDLARAPLLLAMSGICQRVLGTERTRWVRHQLPQWEGPPAYHPAFRRELSGMARRGTCDGVYLASGDPLYFAKGSSLLAFLMRMLAAPPMLGRTNS
jgi:hypothetical protein